MTDRPSKLRDTLDLIAALKGQCHQLRQVEDNHIQPIVAEIELLLEQIRNELDRDSGN